MQPQTAFFKQQLNQQEAIIVLGLLFVTGSSIMEKPTIAWIEESEVYSV